MKKYNFETYEICNFGGLSINTVLDSDIDKFLYFLDNMNKGNLNGFYSLDKFAFDQLFTVAKN